MTIQFTMTLDGLSGNKNAVAVSAVISPPADDQIQIIITDTVDIYRRLEILNGWAWLYNGLRERQLGDFISSIVYTSCPIDDLTTPARKTNNQAEIMVDGDIAIVAGVVATSPPGASVMLDAAFGQLRDFAKEYPLWIV